MSAPVERSVSFDWPGGVRYEGTVAFLGLIVSEMTSPPPIPGIKRRTPEMAKNPDYIVGPPLPRGGTA